MSLIPSQEERKQGWCWKVRWRNTSPGKWTLFLSETHIEITGSQSEGTWVSYPWINWLRSLRVLRNVNICIGVLEWRQKSQLWIVFAWCVFPWLSCVNSVYSPGESFSTMEWLVFTCLGSISWILPFLWFRPGTKSREGAGPGEDAQRLMSWPGGNQTFSSDSLTYRKPPGSKIICSSSFVPLEATVAHVPDNNKYRLGGVGSKYCR